MLKINRHTLATLGFISVFIYPTLSSAWPGTDINAVQFSEEQCGQCHSSATEQNTVVEQPVDTSSTTEQTVDTDSESTATAQICETEPHRKSCRLLAEFDLDQNGQIELTEVKAAQEAFFNAADTDQNAELTLEELQAAQEVERQTQRAERFYELDTDDDNLLSEDELQSNIIGKFGKMGHFIFWLDSDGVITLEEFQAHPVTEVMSCGEAKFSRLDNDGDGVISQTEFIDNVPLFDKFDADEDGIITWTELEALGGRHQKKGHFKGGHFRGHHFRR